MDRASLDHASLDCGPADERPLVVAEKIKGAMRICAVDPYAWRLGLRPGLALADARARVLDFAVVKADVRADARLLERLAVLCTRFSPHVALDPPEGLCLDITGCAHLFGGEGGLRIQAMARFTRAGLNVRAALAGTPEAARALARFGTVIATPPGGDEAFVRSLPVAALHGVEPGIILALSRAGLKTLGDLASRPPQILAARFGADLVTRLERTLGRMSPPLAPLLVRPDISAVRHFLEPFTAAEALLGVLAELIGEVAAVLETRGQGGRVYEAVVVRSDGAMRSLKVETGRPTRDVLSLKRLFAERLAALVDPIEAGFGFDAVRLNVPVFEPLAARQTVLGPGLAHPAGRTQDAGEACEAVAGLVDRLTARHGRERVLRLMPCDTHDPEAQARHIPAADAAPAPASSLALSPWPYLEPGEPPVRPLTLFSPPQPIDALAEVPDGPPRRFRWRRVLHEVAKAEGPERIAPLWWGPKKGDSTRDYYRLEDVSGCRFWVFRAGSYGERGTEPRWFLHGVFA